jgi:hypothetical protein
LSAFLLVAHILISATARTSDQAIVSRAGSTPGHLLFAEDHREVDEATEKLAELLGRAIARRWHLMKGRLLVGAEPMPEIASPDGLGAALAQPLNNDTPGETANEAVPTEPPRRWRNRQA